eukprot:320041_1
MDEEDTEENYIYELDAQDGEYKSGCCMREHSPGIPMVLCTHQACDIWHCKEWVTSQLSINTTQFNQLCESNTLFKCREHGFIHINVSELQQNESEPFEEPAVEIEMDDVKELAIETKRTNRQTEEQEQINVLFRRTCINGILFLEIHEKGTWKAVTKGIMHKYKKKVFQDILSKLFGYEQIKQNKSKLESILYACCGIEEDPKMLVEKVLGSEGLKAVVASIDNAKIGLPFDLFDQMQNEELVTKKSYALSNISGYLEDVFSRLYLLGDAQNTLIVFLEYIWDNLLEIWELHPTDKEYITDALEFTHMYHDSKEYKDLETEYINFQHQQGFQHKHLPFSSFAYGMYLQIDGLLKNLIEKTVLKIALEQTTKSISSKRYSDEQRLYLVQSMGGATVNSGLRKAYGGNFADDKRNMLVDILRSMLLPKDAYESALIAFRIRVENNGGYRILKQKWTNWFGDIINLIQPEIPNIILRYKGDFNVILRTLLDNSELRERYYQIMSEEFPIESTDNDDEDVDIQTDDEDVFDSDLYRELITKVFKESVCGVYNRCIWGYLKSRRPERGSLTLRNSLKLSMSTTKQNILHCNQIKN